MYCSILSGVKGGRGFYDRHSKVREYESHHGFEQHHDFISHNELFGVQVAPHILPVKFGHQICDLYPVNYST